MAERQEVRLVRKVSPLTGGHLRNETGAPLSEHRRVDSPLDPSIESSHPLLTKSGRHELAKRPEMAFCPGSNKALDPLLHERQLRVLGRLLPRPYELKLIGVRASFWVLDPNDSRKLICLLRGLNELHPPPSVALLQGDGDGTGR